MCMVSAMYDTARTIPLPMWTPPAVDEFKEIIRRLDELDKKLGQKDCVDPSKAEFMKQLEERVRKLELQNQQATGTNWWV